MESMFQMWILIHLAGLSAEDVMEGFLYMPAVISLGSAGLIRCIYYDICPDLLPGTLLLLTARISKEKIGYGDAWLIFAMGLWIRKTELYRTLFLAAFGAALYALIRKKKEVPFVPFLTAAYILTKGAT